MLQRVARLCTVALLIYLVLPLLVIVPVSFTDERTLSLPSESLSLQHYASLFADGDWLAAAAQSLLIGASSATLATALGFLAASAVWLNRGLSTRMVTALAVMPMVVPPIVTALGLYKLYVPTRLIDTYAGVIAAHVIVGLPYAFVLCLAGLSATAPSLFHTARSLGAPPLAALCRVVLPSVWPAVLSGWIFAFLHSWDELLITLFVSSRTVYTLPRMMWDGLNENLDPVIASVSVLLLLLSTLLLFARELLGRKAAPLRASRAPQGAMRAERRSRIRRILDGGGAGSHD
ncbi:ABC transporter permease [Pigmentiphaga soli]|uniref:ABC transporter permease n=1 Tax=Pigmentiphaga soli TaxID=1007095 RepID=A0ABP8GP71_9BURK